MIGQDWGRINWNLRGSYTIEQHDFVNIGDPTDSTDYEDGIGSPYVRFLSTVSW